MDPAAGAGFSLVEFAIVFAILGTVLAFAVPAFGRYMDSLAVKGSADEIASALTLTRDRAMATRTSQTMQFQSGYQGTDYRVEIDGVVRAGWTLPKRVSYAWVTGTINSVTMTPDGRCSASGLVIVENARGLQDTVSILSSVLFLRH